MRKASAKRARDADETDIGERDTGFKSDGEAGDLTPDFLAGKSSLWGSVRSGYETKVKHQHVTHPHVTAKGIYF